MWKAFSEVLPQAVAIEISPIPVVLVILMLISARARTNGPSFALGWSVGLLGLALIAFAVSDTADVSSDPAAAGGWSTAQVLLGLVFLALAVREWQHRPRRGVEPSLPKLFDVVDSMSAAKALALGMAGAVANPKNLPLALSAGIAISRSGANGGAGVGAVVLFSLTASLTVLAPVALVLAVGERTQGPLDSVKAWLLSNNSIVMVVLLAVLGAKMLGDGLAHTGA